MYSVKNYTLANGRVPIHGTVNVVRCRLDYSISIDFAFFDIANIKFLELIVLKCFRKTVLNVFKNIISNLKAIVAQ